MTAEDAEKRKTHTGVTAWVFQEENEELFQALREANAMLVEPGHRVDGGIAIGVNFKV